LSLSGAQAGAIPEDENASRARNFTIGFGAAVGVAVFLIIGIMLAMLRRRSDQAATTLAAADREENSIIQPDQMDQYTVSDITDLNELFQPGQVLSPDYGPELTDRHDIDSYGFSGADSYGFPLDRLQNQHQPEYEVLEVFPDPTQNQPEYGESSVSDLYTSNTPDFPDPA
jgi:hypothetical protein